MTQRDATRPRQDAMGKRSGDTGGGSGSLKTWGLTSAYVQRVVGIEEAYQLEVFKQARPSPTSGRRRFPNQIDSDAAKFDRLTFR